MVLFVAATSTAYANNMGLIIFSGSDHKAVLFANLNWTSSSGGTITDAAGSSTPFSNSDVEKIVYFNSLYYKSLDVDPQSKSNRHGVRDKEVVANTDFWTKLTNADVKTLQDSQHTLASLAQSYSNTQSLIQPQIDLINDDIDRLNKHQHLESGTWESSYGPVSFTLKDGTKFANSYLWYQNVTDSQINVDGTLIPIDKLADDISTFPKVVQDQIAKIRANNIATPNPNVEQDTVQPQDSPQPPAKDGHDQDQNDAAMAFSLSGVQLGMTLDQINALGFQVAPFPDETDSSANVVAYILVNVPNVHSIVVELFKGRVFQVYGNYPAQTVDSFGGWDSMYDKFIARLGPSDENQADARAKHVANWQFYTANRYFRLYTSDNGDTTLQLADKAAALRMVEVKRAAGDTHPHDKYEAARDFSLSGIKLGLSAQDLKALGYDLQPNTGASDTVANALEYDIENVPNVDFMTVQIFNGTISSFFIGYNVDSVNKLGGWGAMYDRLVSKFGPSEEDSAAALKNHHATWKVASVDRAFIFVNMPSGGAVLDVCDIDACHKIGEIDAANTK